MTNPQPFDPGYDYEQDKDICERLENKTFGHLDLHREAAGEIRALRLLIKNMERTINNLIAERDAEVEPWADS